MINLKIDDSSYLELKFDDSKERLCLLDDIKISYCDNKRKYVLFDDEVVEAFECFLGLLKKGLDNTLQIHPSIKYDIGYLWQEYLTYNSNMSEL